MPARRPRLWLHVVLVLATLATTTLAGAGYYASFLLDFRTPAVAPEFGALLVGGLWFSGTLLAILGAHELGHYLGCRHYRVNASLPYFLPFIPIGIAPGTIGAFIRIREQISSKRKLFDIGVAGPIAGFAVAVPALCLGLALSRVVPLPRFEGISYEFNEPLLFRLASWAIVGPIPDGLTLNLHPMGFAAWWGLFVTALNLIPIGQLDGGHISYALLGRRSSTVTKVTLVIVILLTILSLHWLVWSVLLILMLRLFGLHHPRTLDEEIPLGRGRTIVALAAILIFVSCFTPVPVEMLVGPR